MENIDNRPLYSIGIVAELLDVHPETIRTWERSGLIRPPQRRSGRRTFSGVDLKRLEFINWLATEGLSIRAIRYHLRLYPCWNTDDCIQRRHYSNQDTYTKPCWRDPSAFCEMTSNESLCVSCENRISSERTEMQTVYAKPLIQSETLR